LILLVELTPEVKQSNIVIYDLVSPINYQFFFVKTVIYNFRPSFLKILTCTFQHSLNFLLVFL
jgi:hypothetical protein